MFPSCGRHTSKKLSPLVIFRTGEYRLLLGDIKQHFKLNIFNLIYQIILENISVLVSAITNNYNF